MLSLNSCIIILSTKNSSERDKKMVQKKTYIKFTTKKKIGGNIFTGAVTSIKKHIHRQQIKKISKQRNKGNK